MSSILKVDLDSVCRKDVSWLFHAALFARDRLRNIRMAKRLLGLRA